jgi:hypothetical protein
MPISVNGFFARWFLGTASVNKKRPPQLIGALTEAVEIPTCLGWCFLKVVVNIFL